MSENQEQQKSERQQGASGQSGKHVLLWAGGIIVGALLLISAGNAGWLTATAASEVPQEPPVITGMSATPERIMPRTVVAVSCEATHPGEAEMSYTWAASEGEIRGEGPEVEWVAPAIEGLHRIFVIVEDEHGASAEESLTLRVRENTPPEITAMGTDKGDDVGWVVPGTMVYIWCEAEDVDGDSLTYEWTADAGELFGEGTSVVWEAPDTLGIHWVSAKVDDGYGGVAERSVPLNVNAAEPPAIHGFHVESQDRRYFQPYYEDSWQILKGLSCTIKAIVEDEGRDYRYEWTAEAGEITYEGPHAVWQAPSPSRARWVTILLQVSDVHGNEASEALRMLVQTCPACM